MTNFAQEDICKVFVILPLPSAGLVIAGQPTARHSYAYPCDTISSQRKNSRNIDWYLVHREKQEEPLITMFMTSGLRNSRED
jgi:hypothetical protein